LSGDTDFIGIAQFIFLSSRLVEYFYAEGVRPTDEFSGAGQTAALHDFKLEWARPRPLQ